MKCICVHIVVGALRMLDDDDDDDGGDGDDNDDVHCTRSISL